MKHRGLSSIKNNLAVCRQILAERQRPLKSCKKKLFISARKKRVKIGELKKSRIPGFVSAVFHLTVIIFLTFLLTGKIRKAPKEIEVTVHIDREELLEIPPAIEDTPEIPEPDLAAAIQHVTDSKIREIKEAGELTIDEVINEAAETVEFSKVMPPSVKGLSLKYNKSATAFTGRSSANKSTLLQKYGGTEAGQNALLKGLRWLKKQQQPDGRWYSPRGPAESMTALSLLSFLAFGATTDHEEFGKTVKKAIQWLLAEEKYQRGLQIGARHSGYQHPIVTFALCEASALHRNDSLLREAMNRTVVTMLKGQNRDGGFPYIYGNPRSYLTLSGWNALALKAAFNARCRVYGMHEAGYALIRYYKSQYRHNDGFYYNGPSNGTHRGIGCSGLQFFGEAESLQVKNTLRLIGVKDLKRSSFRDFYAMYYLNLSIFNAGGKLWKIWVAPFQNHLIKAQYKDGFWNPQVYGDSLMNTSLACLMLTVFYRYPPANSDKSSPLIPLNRKAFNDFMNEELDVIK